MLEWSHLPIHIQQKCIKEMSLITSMRLAMCSRRSLALVESIGHQIPRVRFCKKEGRYLVVFYTGIKKFVRFEFWPQEIGCVMYRFENNFDIKTVRHCMYDSERMAINVFQSIFLLSYAKFGSFEFELERIHDDKDKVRTIITTLLELSDYLKDKEVVLIGPVSQIHTFQSLKISASRLQVACPYPDSDILNSDNLLPSFVDERWRGEFEQLTLVFDQVPYPTVRPVFQLLKCEDNIFYCPSSDYASQEAFFEEQSGEVIVYKKGDMWLKVKKATPHNICHLSSCGIWTDRTDPTSDSLGQFRQKYPSFQNFCGLGHFCKIHSDPFELWYHCNLPRRLIEEPFWADAIRDMIPPAISNQITSVTAVGNEPKKIGSCPVDFEAIDLLKVTDVYDADEIGPSPKSWKLAVFLVFSFFILFFLSLTIICSKL